MATEVAIPLVNGRYQPAQAGEAGIYRSTVLDGFWLNVNWLWQEPLPTLRQVWRQYE